MQVNYWLQLASFRMDYYLVVDHNFAGSVAKQGHRRNRKDFQPLTATDLHFDY